MESKNNGLSQSNNWIKFIGTAGARFVVMTQLRASGGIWLSLEGSNIYLDPGPGALVRCLASRPKLDPTKLDAIILSHKHLDHSNDVNVMIEAMTNGGLKKRGIVLAPKDAYEGDPVILKYAQQLPEKIEILEAGKKYTVGKVNIFVPVQHIHAGAITYGLIFSNSFGKLAYIADTRYFPELANYYKGCDVAIINTVRHRTSDTYEIDHLSFDDLKLLLPQIKPKLAIITHFGMTALRAKPFELTAKLSEETGIRAIAATDGLLVDLSKI